MSTATGCPTSCVVFKAALKDLEATFERSDIVVRKGKLQSLIDTIVIKNKGFKVNFHLSPAAD
jgi:hypothetical protein